MKLAIVGSRRYSDFTEMEGIIRAVAEWAKDSQLFDSAEISEIITGGAYGADELAARYAREHEIRLTIIRPDYERYYAKVAPLQRNTAIVAKADIVLAFYAGVRQGGTLDTARKTLSAGKPLIEVLNGQVRNHLPQRLL